MNIIQQDFKVTSRIWFIFSLFATLFFAYAYYAADIDELGGIYFKLVTGSFVLSIAILNAYRMSFSYEFRQKELITCSLFTFWRKRIYGFKNLTKIECKINSRGIIDTIYLYFGDESFKNRVGINMFQVDLGKVKLFLFANVENMEEILVETYRVPNDD